jgi:3D (Asp-Asp-Asp) domain-containing protein
MRQHLALLALTGSMLLSSCSSTVTSVQTANGKANSKATRITSVKTTAYTHSEADHIALGPKTALGTTLRYGRVRSAAADWSVYPVGTVFQIDGDPNVYEVDDYGSALVGTNTIDLYKPDHSAMNAWGSRRVNIKVLKWGSFTRSLAIMKPRTGAGHIRRMVDRIQRTLRS